MKQRALVCLFLQLTFELFSCTTIWMLPGSSVDLPCFFPPSYFPDPNITWTFNGQTIQAAPPTSGSAQVIKEGLYISISPVTPASEGEYVCLAKVNNVEVIKTYNLTVYSVRNTIKAPAGSDVYLPCYFSSSGPFEENALWFKETGDGKRKELKPGNDFPENEKLFLLYPEDQDQTIILKSAKSEDSGVYSCESAEGERLHTIQLIVKDAPTHSCKEFNRTSEVCREEDRRTAGPILQESMAEFSMKLYSHLKDQHPSNNLLFSPVSIGGILSHLLLGASDNTRKALERAICVPHDFQCFHFQMKKQRQMLAGSMQMASQIYYNPQMNLSESFTNRSVEYYEAEPTKLLESSEENTKMINQWVANKTKNKITNLIDSVAPDAQLILLNAVTFSGQWKFKFSGKPGKGHFTKLNGDLYKVPFIHHSKYMASMMYVPELKAQVAKFLLSGDNSLYVLLPNTHNLVDLQQVERRMTDENMRHMIGQLNNASPQNIEVTLPLIKLEGEPNMISLLKKLGLSSLFEGARLCGLSSEGHLVLDDARHKAFLALTEHGVEAGAATTVSFSRSFPSFSALRPFVLLLWNDEANMPLFIGRVTEP
ncbi:plasma protease C1 inhibitor [Kryptolebias marmoratus]|uniref:Serpin peptidase inhibitor, clade G (C1 inhibitor), member 1 n=1 Tax=Kryptolebias marmoratus TaxID=37003 RepID=A0A3Q2Z9K1_KRYMA|nr:plasma protease C1 inhibitor [Kryptolebias marmoratus]